VSDRQAELVRLTVVQNELEAEIVLALLATEGIQSMQKYTDVAAGGLDGSLGASGSREILVRAADLERARELLDEQ
jgi:hypothetical protein